VDTSPIFAFATCCFDVGSGLLARSVFICPNIAAIGTGNKSVFFGAMDYFIIRRAANGPDGMRVLRNGESYATNAQVGYSAIMRISAGLAKASTADSPIKYLLHA
jgi:HK97 family phage major capsid protein